ncbi:MAG TPA: exodeoxyribonuclease VII large subunit [Pyrinomonadaceae bacterium]|nr:exodeoxyribonuclease VII large subunit [Pyrinomonadaceae bacterium]
MSRTLLMSLFDETERRPLSVTELTFQVRSALEARFASVWVEGEISNFKAAASGHWYFTIKDEGAQLHAKCFRGVNGRIRFRPSDGLQVRVRGRLSVYEPRGEYELIVEALDPVGAGALRVAFEQMRDRLAAEGLFDEELKQPLPLFPRRVGVVTSPTGAAIRDILTVLARRTRTVHVLFAPTRVQGEGASAEIAQAIRLLNDFNERALAEGRADECIDVIIVGRGGGSAEDLWAFNEEGLARAIRASLIPVISAVGHETDVTIADFAADLRAPTPSAAAELVAAREDELAAYVLALTRDLVRSARSTVVDARLRVQEAAMSPAFDEARERLHAARARADEAAHRIETLMVRAAQTARRRADAVSRRLSPARLGARVSAAHARFIVLRAEQSAAMTSRLEEARARLTAAAASLDALSPLAVLKRGYAMAEGPRGKLLRDARAVKAGDPVRLRLADGVLRCRVEEVENN